MSTRHLRIIRRPTDVDDAAWTRLGDAVAAAVEQQRKLAGQSPHILEPRSNPTEEDGGLVFEHEPATPRDFKPLYDPDAPKAEPAALIKTTEAVFDALAAAHSARSGERSYAHGGLCPGTLLTAPDGTLKITDFGIAPAICQALGTDAYVSLAVTSGAPPEGAPPLIDAEGRGTDGSATVTGAWEVLDPHVFDRDDRICAFIDPEKYGTRALAAFEPPSDVIAAGFLLHLLAEHQHPYLSADADAHRLVEMSQFMGMGRYNGARRRDLRESDDPAVRLWCDLIGKTLARLPKNRPTASEILQAIRGEADPDAIAAVLGRKADAPKPPPRPRAPEVQPTPAREDEAPAARQQDKPKKKPIVPIVVTLVVAAAALGAWQLWPKSPAGPAPNANQSGPIIPGPPSNDDANENASPPPIEQANTAAVDNDNEPPPVDPERVKQDTKTPDDGTPTDDAAKRSDDDNDNETIVTPPDPPAVDTRIVEEGAALDRRVARLEQQLERPTHQGLVDVIDQRTIEALQSEVRDYWGRARNAGADVQSRAARDHVARLGELQSKLASYGAILNMSDKPLDEQVRLLETARADWPTQHVRDLLDGLPEVADLLTEADQRLGRGEWRRARSIIDQAARAAERKSLGTQLAPIIDAARTRLAADRRDQIADALVDADALLARIGDPPEPIEHLARTDDAAAARNELDRFDLDFPTGAAPSEVADRAVEQDLLPWTALTEAERTTLQRLIHWTTFDLPVGEEALSLAFVQAAPATGMLDPVWISQTEVTVGLYREVNGELPDGGAQRPAFEAMRTRDDHPIAFVPADGVRPFCGALMATFDNRIIVRPPSEAEWTHALSAGGLVGMDAAPLLARFPDGGEGPLTLNPERANFESDEEYLLGAPGHLDGFGKYAPVRSYPPNRWLFHDMLGNVSEWVTTTTSPRLSSIGGSYVDRHDGDHRRPDTRDQTTPRANIGIRLVIIPAP